MKKSIKQTTLVFCLTLAMVSTQGCKKKKVDGLSDAQDAGGSAIAQSDTSDNADASSGNINEQNLDGSSSLATMSVDQATDVLSNLNTIYFGYDQAGLKAQDRSQLQRIASALQTINSSNLSIQGHADERGSNEYNLALGDRRANAVYDYLMSLGVSSSQISALSYGEEKPAVYGMSEQSWSKNRRAELVQK